MPGIRGRLILRVKVSGFVGHYPDKLSGYFGHKPFDATVPDRFEVGNYLLHRQMIPVISTVLKQQSLHRRDIFRPGGSENYVGKG